VVYQNLSFRELEKHLDDIFSAGYSVSLFTDWQNHRATQVWIKSKVEPGRSFEIAPEFYGATAAKQKLHPLAGHSAENCTDQLGIPGPWYERMPHFRMNFTPSSGAELQTEYLVPRARAWEAIRAVEGLRDAITPHLFITELRTIDADNLWMSSAYQRPSLAIHFTWKPEWPQVKAVLPRIEAALEPFAARPHWAKLFTMEGSRVRPLYERLPDFLALVKHYDASGKFRNQFLNNTIFS
jgi:xylitol oxidase